MIVFLTLTTISCVAQKQEVISKSTIKLEVENTNIREVIEIDGYYQSVDDTKNHIGMIFFEDGMCFSIMFKENETEEMKRKNLSQAIITWKQKGQIRCGFYCSIYKIDKDTIVVQTVDKAGIFNHRWSLDEIKYEIIDRQTLKLIYYKPLLKMYEDYEWNKFPYEISKKNYVYEFVTADFLPPSDCWLKEEKWIWRNESDWKTYMERIKQKKKGKK